MFHQNRAGSQSGLSRCQTIGVSSRTRVVARCHMSSNSRRCWPKSNRPQVRKPSCEPASYSRPYRRRWRLLGRKTHRRPEAAGVAAAEVEAAEVEATPTATEVARYLSALIDPNHIRHRHRHKARSSCRRLTLLAAQRAEEDRQRTPSLRRRWRCVQRTPSAISLHTQS